MGSVYYSDDLVTLYHGDALEVDAWRAADVLIFDPPYGRAWRQGTISGMAKNAASEGIANDRDTTVRDDLLELWGPDRPALAFGDLMLPPPANTRLVGIYRKPADAGLRGAIGGVRRDVEAVYMLNRWPSGLGGRSAVFSTAVANVGNPAGIVARSGGHPHAKPGDVMAELVALTSGTIADPTAGGGATLVAAKAAGRPAIGVELEERYCEVIARRLSQGALDFGATA